MNLESILTVIIASVSSGGMVAYLAKKLLEGAIDHQFRLHETRQNIIWQHEIAYRKAQLEELYGPIYSMLKTNAKIYRLWMDNKINDANFDVKQYFESNNNEIRKLLILKMHLVDGGEMPPQFVDFMTSAMIWNWYCAKNPEASFPPDVQALPEVQWPEEFEQYIYTKTEELKHRLDNLYRRNRIE